jgi:glutathione S-transferase
MRVMPKLRLFTQPTNPFTAKVELALALKGQPYERETSSDSADIKRWSPKTGMLPVLEIDGQRIEDSEKILDALEERFPEPPLLSADPKTARDQRRLAEWSNDSFLYYWNRWREVRYPRPGDEQPADNPSLLGKLRGSIAATFTSQGREMSRRELREAEVINGVAARFADLSAFLGERDFYYADVPSRADISVFGMLNILHDGPMPGVRQLIDEREELRAYMRRMDDWISKAGASHSFELPPP